MKRMAAAPLDTMKNTRSRRPDHVRVIGADVCEAPNPQRTPRKGIFCHPRAVFAIRTYNLPSEPSKLPKSPQNAIFGNKKADRITPIGSHTCHVLVSFN